MSKKQRCSSMALLPHDVVGQILERLPTKSLLRFKCVSKKWKSTIESSYFQKRQLIRRGDPQVLLLYMSCDDVAVGPNIQALESPLTAVKIPTEKDTTFVSQTSCDGLVCAYSVYNSGLVTNPTTGWSRAFPPSRFQLAVFDLPDKFFELTYPFPLLGFGKDNVCGTYKPVFLYNSPKLGDKATSCEVFDFDSNTWRYVVPSSPHRILAHREPLYLDGSLHWFTESEEKTNVLSFHLHAETFQFISHTPPPFVDLVRPEDITMCCLDNRLCVSQKKGLEQFIWSFGPSKTWVKLYSIDLSITSWFGMHTLALSALELPATTGGGKTKLMLYDREYYKHEQRLVLHDPETKSYDLVFTAKSIGLPLCYFQSLISIS